MEVAHPQTESKPLRSGEEQKFIDALSVARICQVNEERSLAKVIEEVKGAFRYIFVLLGLKAENIPAEEEKAVLIEYVMENYGGHTAEELKLAFKLAIQGKLGLEQKEIVCYQNFSPLYMTTIMDAYRDWAKEQVKLLAPPPVQKELTKEEKLQRSMHYLWLMFDHVNKLPVRIHIYDQREGCYKLRQKVSCET